MMRENSQGIPCAIHCERRSPTCHGECEAYLKYREGRLAVAEDRLKQQEYAQLMRGYDDAVNRRIVKNRHSGGSRR